MRVQFLVCKYYFLYREHFSLPSASSCLCECVFCIGVCASTIIYMQVHVFVCVGACIFGVLCMDGCNYVGDVVIVYCRLIAYNNVGDYLHVGAFWL